MESLTKRRPPRTQLQAWLYSALGPDAELAGLTECTDGWFNAVYAVTLTDGREVILKVAPPADMKLMRYEGDLLYAEAQFYRQAAGCGMPQPALLHVDLDQGYLVLERLRGTPLDKVAGTLAPAALAGVRRQVGAASARLHTVTGPAFGYIRRDGRTQSQSWRTSFLAIIDDVLADATELNTELPAPPDRIGALIHRHADVLDEVTRPALVHFDLWDGNAFVLEQPDGSWRLEGVIDGERAFWGDPVAELVSLAVFAEPEDSPGLLEGYAEAAGAPLRLEGSARQRLTLYRIYLDLILATEGATRGYGEEHDGVRLLALEKLDAELGLLGRV
ncbi:phosphotransferase family protein [Peterkaempfera griseoplana]|uniref:phosphotransferase family protein n=1 Tax=Peterkaempfera griseoplana TaxID=66896 RepID=UPI0006E209A0|nr:aminoglycoside phosphotransferase family protein [Peterkaempfera griseoplana]